MSPLDLYDIAIAYKLKLLHGDKIDFKYELAKHSLLFMARQSNKPGDHQRTVKLIKADEQLKEKNPEHAAMHLQVLLKTMDLLLEPNKKDYKNYRGLSNYHHQRGPLPWPGNPIAAFVNVVVLLFLCTLLLNQIMKATGLVAPVAEPASDNSQTSTVVNTLIGSAIGGLIGGLSTRVGMQLGSRLQINAAKREIEDNALTDALDEMLSATPAEVQDDERTDRSYKRIMN